MKTVIGYLKEFFNKILLSFGVKIIGTVAELLIRIAACFVLVRALADYTGLLWGWTAGSCSGGLMCIIISIYVLKKRLNPAKSLILMH